MPSSEAARPDARDLSNATPPPARECEWLLADGVGGYACGTAADLATRRYHGLWIARAGDDATRSMMVAGLDERVGPARSLGGGEPAAADFAHLMHAHWRSLPAPSAPDAAVRFTRLPLPTWQFETRHGVLERTVALQRVDVAGAARPALLVRWQNRGDRPVRLVVRPLLGCCDVDHLPPVAAEFDGNVLSRGAAWGFRPDHALPPLFLSVAGIAAFRAEPVWYRDFHYELDRLRGYDHVGHRFSPGVLELDLAAGAEAIAAFALHEPLAAPDDAFLAVASHAARTAAVVGSQGAGAQFHARLAAGADDFLYRSSVSRALQGEARDGAASDGGASDGGAVAGRLGVLAGFPWFGEWGRDVFVALPGLTLARAQPAACAEVLRGCLPFLRDGLLPNIYGRNADDSRYDSCDAALWFALAVARFADEGHQPDFVAAELVPALRDIVAAYRRGTGLGLAVGSDGLLAAGGPDLNATWMDARTSAGPVTPRHGFAVEIQALWYSLLAFLAERDRGAAAAAEATAALRDRCGRSFVKRFWLGDRKWLADRVHDGVAIDELRANMLVAAALPRSPLTLAQRRGVVAAASRELLTPCGVRTLASDDPAYVGVYGGGPMERDRAYHQGTVWPWPLGFFVEAELRCANKRQRRKVATERLAWLDGLLQRELDRAGLGHVSEVFDGDPPHRPGGTFAQAWNTGELLRCYALCRAELA